MDGMFQSGAKKMEDFRLLAYVQYMSQTAESDEARQIFKAYLEDEVRRIDLEPIRKPTGP